VGTMILAKYFLVTESWLAREAFSKRWRSYGEC